MSIEQIQVLHDEAMMIADDADLLKRQGKFSEAQELFSSAFDKEREAALAAISSDIEDLSTNVLLKSAAFLGFDAGYIRESEQLVGLALSRNIPEEIAEEMRDLLENIHFARHLRLNGVALSDNEVQIVVAGNGVAHGMAREDDVNERINTFKRMAVRTAERNKGRRFRTRGQPAKDIRDICTSYLSTPRAASFAITMRIGKTQENTIESFQGGANAIIEDIATNLSLVNKGDLSGLKGRIKDQSYLENFVSLAKEFAPDGERVNLVGLTFYKEGREFPVQLTTPKAKYRDFVSSITDEDGSQPQGEESITKQLLTGVLFAADSQSFDVHLQIREKRVKISVPEGLTEIVRKYFDTEVSVMVAHNRSDDTYKLLSLDAREEVPTLF